MTLEGYLKTKNIPYTKSTETDYIVRSEHLILMISSKNNHYSLISKLESINIDQEVLDGIQLEYNNLMEIVYRDEGERYDT